MTVTSDTLQRQAAARIRSNHDKWPKLSPPTIGQ